MKYLVCFVLFLIWAYILYVLKKCDLKFWHFLLGSAGLFVFMMVLIRPIFTQPLANVVATIAGIPGQLTGFYSTVFKYGIIFVDSIDGAISLTIDFECSGIIEIMAYISLLAFFEVYTRYERIFVGIVGVCLIMLSNAVRIMFICLIIHYWGVGSYYVAHAFIGRLLFYGLSVMLYFYVFTKPQIIKQRVGGFHYDK